MLQVNVLHLTFLLIWLGLKIQHRQCPRVASRSDVLQIHWPVLSLRNAPGLTVMTILQLSLLTIVILGRCPKFARWKRERPVEQGCLTCRTVLRLQLKPKPRQGKVNQQWMKIMWNLSQKDVDNLLVSFSSNEETTQQIYSNPDAETAVNVMVKRRRAEVEVSTLSAERRREIAEAKDKEFKNICPVFSGRSGIASRNLAVCTDENALGRDIQG